MGSTNVRVGSTIFGERDPKTKKASTASAPEKENYDTKNKSENESENNVKSEISSDVEQLALA
jgi:hypothetical protein